MGFFDDLPAKVADIVMLPITVPLEIADRIAGGGTSYEEPKDKK